MADDRSRRSLPVRLGAPGPYVLAAWLGALLWFPVRLLLERGDELNEVALNAGLWGAMWGITPLVTAAIQRHRERSAGTADETWEWTRAALRAGRMPATEDERSAVAGRLPAVRRGALIGLGAAVPLFGGLAGLAAIVGQPVIGALFGLVLVVVVAIAVRTLIRVRRLGRHLVAHPVRPDSREPT